MQMEIRDEMLLSSEGYKRMFIFFLMRRSIIREFCSQLIKWLTSHKFIPYQMETISSRKKSPKFTSYRI